MKIFCFSFIVYLFMIMTQPCQDVFAAAPDRPEKRTFASRSDAPADTDQHTDECSPFCVCACCSLAATHHSFTSAINSQAIAAQFSVLLVDYDDPYATNYLDSIWQPPKA